MKLNLRLCLMLVIVVAILASCKRSAPDQTKFIPKDASVVLSINAKSLHDKLAGGNLNLDSLFTAMQEENKNMPSDIKSWGDEKVSGIDLSENVYVFVQQKGSVMNGSTTSTGIIAKLKDASTFEAFLKKQKPDAVIKEEKNYKYAPAGNGFVAGWNKDIVILSFVASGNYSTGMNSDAGTAAQAQLTALFNQDKDASVASIPEFKDLMSEKGDVLFWTNSNAGLASIPMLGMTKFADLFKDAYSAGKLDFEDGKAVFESKSYTGKDLSSIFKKYAGPEVDYSLVENYPSKINGFAAFSFNPQIIAEIIRFGGVEATVNQFAEQAGFTMDDVLKAFKGDFAVVFSDVATVEKENPYVPEMKTKTPSAKLIVVATIGDRKSYDKVVTRLAEKGMMVQKNGQYVPKELSEGAGGYAFSADGDKIIFATDDVLLQQYKAAKGNAGVPADVKSDAGRKAIYFYFDIASVLNAFQIDTSATTTEIMNSAKATFKDLRAGTDNFDGKSVTGNVELRTMNEKENSLVSIIRFFTIVAQKYKQQSMMPEPPESSTDTTQMMPDTTTH